MLPAEERVRRLAWGAFGLWVALLVAQVALTLAVGGGPDAFAWSILTVGFPLAAILILYLYRRFVQHRPLTGSGAHRPLR